MKSKRVLVISGVLAVIIGLVLFQLINKRIVPMNNQTCPVSGHPVNGKDVYIHEGKAYNLCNDKCKQSLSESPKKYFPD